MAQVKWYFNCRKIELLCILGFIFMSDDVKSGNNSPKKWCDCEKTIFSIFLYILLFSMH